MKTYGSVKYDSKRKRWEIACQPHVAIRLKRVFGKLDKHEHGTLMLSATPENSRDLEWFLTRYPMDVADMKRLTGQAGEFKERTALIDRLLAGMETSKPFDLKLPLRDYQTFATNMWLAAGNLLLADDVGLGKAQPLTAGILTPYGWKSMGDLCVGDEVVDPDGGYGKITGIYPQGVTDVYRLRTTDGASTECCKDHLWLVQTANDRMRKHSRVLPLKDFKDALLRTTSGGQKISNYFIPLIAPVTAPTSVNCSIPPYMLGILLGDGCLREATKFTSYDAEVVDRVKTTLSDDLKVSKVKHSINDYRISLRRNNGHTSNPITWYLRQYGLFGKLSYQKYIPTQYLVAPAKYRVELLRGLMDSDGECSKDGLAYFSTTSKRLALNAVTLIRSLGGIAKVSPPRRKFFTYKGQKKLEHPAWIVSVQTPFNPFHLKRRASRWKKPYMRRAIKSVTFIGKKPTQCIKVSTKRHLYITDDFLPTHNTAVAIAGLTDTRLRPALIVVPTHMPGQWVEQINKFVDGLVCHKLTKASPYDLIAACKGKFPDVIISNYHKLDGWAETIAPLINSVVFDEVQELRHRTSAKYRAAKHIAKAVDFRLGLSATPIYNYGGEIFNVLNVLDPGKLGTWEEFERDWCKYEWGKPAIQDPKAFGMYARETGLMLRRTRIEVRRELPGITIIPHAIEADTAILDKMEGQAIELAKTILKQKQSFKGEIMQASGEFDLKLRQATGIAKAPYVADFVRFIVENDNEKVVLFAWHREVYEILMEKLADLKPVMYTGSESPTQKDASKKAFVSGDSMVMMISLRAGAGLDGLQDVAHIVVVAELDYSPGVHEQNLGRVYRDGQKEGVIAYFLLSEGGSDPIICDILGLKKQQIEGLRDPNQELVSKLQQTQGDHVKKLAAKYLADRGIVVPQAAEESSSEIAANLVS